jgi:hypothetical protein
MDLNFSFIKNIKDFHSFLEKKDSNYIFVQFNNNKKDNISFFIFQDILAKLVFSEENGGFKKPYSIKSHLIIKNENTIYELTNKDDIKKVWLFDNLYYDDINYKFYKLKEIKDIENEQYGIFFKFMEKNMEEMNTKTLTAFKNADKIFLYQNIYEVKYNDDIIVKMIEEKVGNGINFKDSGTIESKTVYKLEIIMKNNFKLEEINKLLYLMISFIQRSNYIISVSEMNDIFKFYSQILSENDIKDFKKFISYIPSPLLRKNAKEGLDTNNILKDYAIAPILNGFEHNLLLIIDSSNTLYSGNVYLLNKYFNLEKLPIKIENYAGSIFDCYYNQNTNEILLEDVIYISNTNVKNEDLFISISKKGEKGRKLSRIENMQKFIEEYKNSMEKFDNVKIEDIPDIKIIKYKFGIGEKNYKNIDELFNEFNNISSLIFKPIKEGYPKFASISNNSFIWKKNNKKYFDFLVKVVKNENGTEDLREPYTLNTPSGTQLFQYKKLNLNITGKKPLAGENNQNIQNSFITAIEFYPKGKAPDNINFARIPIDINDKMIFFYNNRNYEIVDNQIITFTYHKNEPIFNWKPVRINQVLTDKYLNGENIFGMNEDEAYMNWHSIIDNISEEQLRKGDIPDPIIDETYFSNVTKQISANEKMPYQFFHNQYVKTKLIKSVSPAILDNKPQLGNLLDLASGVGGDTQKWYDAKLKKVVGIEIIEENVIEGIKRFKSWARKHDIPRPMVTYIWGDASKLIFPNYESALDDISRKMMEKTIRSKYEFDIVSCQFSVHYFFKDEISLRSLLQNVTDNLKIGGHFIGTAFDGKKLFESLKGLKRPLEGQYLGNPFWKIEKNYKISSWDDEKPMLGNEILVYIQSIGLTHPEFLINFKYFEDIAKEYGLKVVSIKSFQDLFDEAKNDDSYQYFKDMTESEKQFSFFNNQFKFEKIENASDEVYKKLNDKLEKAEAKKDKKKIIVKKKKMTGGGIEHPYKYYADKYFKKNMIQNTNNPNKLLDMVEKNIQESDNIINKLRDKLGEDNNFNSMENIDSHTVHVQKLNHDQHKPNKFNIIKKMETNTIPPDVNLYPKLDENIVQQEEPIKINILKDSDNKLNLDSSISKKNKKKLPKIEPTIEELRNKIKMESAKMNKNISNDIKDITVDPNLKYDEVLPQKSRIIKLV